VSVLKLQNFFTEN